MTEILMIHRIGFFCNNRSEKLQPLKAHAWIRVFNLCTKVRLKCEHLVQLVIFYFTSCLYVTQCIASEGKQLFPVIISLWSHNTLMHFHTQAIPPPGCLQALLFPFAAAPWVHLFCLHRSIQQQHWGMSQNTHTCSNLVQPQQPMRSAPAKISPSLAPHLLQQNSIFTSDTH